jgi:penicillin-binding protein 1C
MKHKKLGLFLLGVTASIGTIFLPLPKEEFRKDTLQSMRVVDRRGVLLREVLSDQQGRGQWKPLACIAASFQSATIAAEDKRFRYHPGVDPIAIVRAAVGNLKKGSLQSGGSTLTQQVIRNVYHHPRTLWYKILEAWYALRLERMMSKQEILEQYVNRAPYGNQLFGVEAAARCYFGKTANDLSLAESAFLAAIPNAPTVFNPHKNPDVVCARQKVVLRRMLQQGIIGKEQFERAIEQPLRIISPEASFRAPHAVEMVLRTLRAYPEASVIETTIDDALQQDVYWIVKARLAALKKKNVTNAAVVIIHNETSEIRALLGSTDYFDEEKHGQVNGALALRQPGSALKPFMYGVALEAGYTPASILADIPTEIADDRGSYIPLNYDRHFHGPVRLRTALACSYNIPAVRVLQTLGVDAFLQRLRKAGFGSLNQPASYYGYALTLGDGEVTLLELTTAYASLASGGIWQPTKLLKSVRLGDRQEQVPVLQEAVPESNVRIYDERVAYLLTDILSDRSARRPAFGNAFRFPFPCAVKTGTTKDYRDNWTVGFTTDYTVGVWAGNFDGSPMHNVSGVTGAGQVFFDIMMLLHKRNPPLNFKMPMGLMRCEVCPRSGNLPTAACGKTILEWFCRGHEPKDRCTVHRAFHLTDNGKEVTRVYEAVPAEFQSWAENERIPAPAHGAVPVSDDPSASHGRTSHPQPSVLYPLDGDQFKIDPILRLEYQSVKVLGSLPENSQHAILCVDNDPVEFNPSGVWWTLKPGRHVMRIQAKVGDEPRLSAPVVIHVE